MLNFHELHTKSEEYVVIETKHKKFLEEFKNFLENQTILAGKAKEGKSGKAGSYYRHLVRLIEGCENYSKIKINNLYDERAYNLLLRFTQLPIFIPFNKDKDYFYSSTISNYRKFLDYLTKAYEEELDTKMNLESETIKEKDINTDFVAAPKEKASKKNNNGIMVYPRSAYEVRLSKELSNWECEMDSSHQTFISQSNSKNYIEAHHLIPMHAQDDFEKSIDFADNIVCLCPNCHRRIHYSTNEDKEFMVTRLYLLRKEKYPEYSIDITREKLLEYYVF